MTYDGNGYAILDERERLIAWDGMPPEVDHPPLHELAEQDARDRRARREAVTYYQAQCDECRTICDDYGDFSALKAVAK